MEDENKDAGGQDVRGSKDNMDKKSQSSIKPKVGKKVVPKTTDRHGVNTEGIPGQEDIDDKMDDSEDIDKDTTRAF